MRIDYVITDLDIGGAETQAVLLLERLARNGHEVRLITLIPPKAFLDRLTQARVPVCSLGMRSYADFVVALFGLLKLFRHSPPDVVHAHMVHANILVRLSRLFRPRLRIVCTAHNTVEGGALRDWAYRITNGLSQLNTTVSEAATRRFIRDRVFPVGKTRTIFNGIDLEKFVPAYSEVIDRSPAEFVWIAVGRLSAQKDLPTLLEAFTHLRNGRLVIVGGGELGDALHAQVRQLDLTLSVDFMGWQPDTAKLYRKADGFVLSSEWEGYGLVVAEAMASGLPVVVTKSGGPEEIVGLDAQAGFVVPIKSPDRLSEAMNRVMRMSPADRVRMGLRGRKRIEENFAIERIILEWERLYRDLLA
jgi:glycosyltransferase involved in cell wall biosynthesis